MPPQGPILTWLQKRNSFGLGQLEGRDPALSLDLRVSLQMEGHRPTVWYDEAAWVLCMDERIRQVNCPTAGVRHLRLVSENAKTTAATSLKPNKIENQWDSTKVTFKWLNTCGWQLLLNGRGRGSVYGTLPSVIIYYVNDGIGLRHCTMNSNQFTITFILFYFCSLGRGVIKTRAVQLHLARVQKQM